MNRMIVRTVTVAASMALLGSAALTGAAGAGAGDVTPTEAWGAQAIGPVVLSQVARATTDNTPQVASHANLAGLLATGPITDRADITGAWSRVTQGIVLTLPNNGSLNAAGVRSWCIYNDDSPFGGAAIFSGAIVQVGQITVPLPENPAPNTVITLPDAAGTITLNEQTSTAGRLTVNAIHAVLGSQTVNLGITQCGEPVIG
jgi:hypothetical protein